VSQVLRVHALERDGESLIGIEVVSKTVTSYHMLPIVLTEAQARALGSLLRDVGPHGHTAAGCSCAALAVFRWPPTLGRTFCFICRLTEISNAEIHYDRLR
jgi:hypothetical protein